jgi:hypothetical protein
MQLFIAIIDETFGVLAIGLWVAVCHRFSLFVSPTHRNDRIVESSFSIAHNYPFADGSPLEGIISYLTRKCGGHIGNRGIISITASSVYDPINYPLRNIADFENRTFFFSKNDVNSWICYDFKNMGIKPIHYSIRSRPDDNHHLRSWTLEGSMDCQSWQELDRRESNTALSSQCATAIFSISRSLEIQIIRLRQPSQNSSGIHQLIGIPLNCSA